VAGNEDLVWPVLACLSGGGLYLGSAGRVPLQEPQNGRGPWGSSPGAETSAFIT